MTLSLCSNACSHVFDHRHCPRRLCGSPRFFARPLSLSLSLSLFLSLSLSLPPTIYVSLLFHLQGLWSTVVLVLRAKSDDYEVQVHSGGPVLVVPEKFSERNLVRFLSEVLLSFS